MATTITTAQASSQLGLEEQNFRQLLKPIYPSTWQTVKRISQKSFKTIAEELHTKAIDQHPDVDMEVLEQSIEQEISDQQTLLQLEDSTDDSINSNGNTSVDSLGDSLSAEGTEETTEENALANIPSQEIELKVRQVIDTNPALREQVLDLSRITRTVAILASDKAVSDFEQIYTARFNAGMKQTIDNFSKSALDAIAQTENERVTDFFDGLDLNYSNDGTATDKLKIMLAQYQSPTV